MTLAYLAFPVIIPPLVKVLELRCLYFFVLKKLFIRVQSIYSAVLVSVYSKMNQIYIYIYPLYFRFFSQIGYYRVLSGVPCAIQ